LFTFGRGASVPFPRTTALTDPRRPIRSARCVLDTLDAIKDRYLKNPGPLGRHHERSTKPLGGLQFRLRESVIGTGSTVARHPLCTSSIYGRNCKVIGLLALGIRYALCLRTSKAEHVCFSVQVLRRLCLVTEGYPSCESQSRDRIERLSLSRQFLADCTECHTGAGRTAIAGGLVLKTPLCISPAVPNITSRRGVRNREWEARER